MAVNVCETLPPRPHADLGEVVPVPLCGPVVREMRAVATAHERAAFILPDVQVQVAPHAFGDDELVA